MTSIFKVICDLECTRILNWLIRFFPFFAIFSENEELKEQLAQLAETKVRIDYIILIIIITVRSGQEAKCVNNLLSTI